MRIYCFFLFPLVCAACVSSPRQPIVNPSSICDQAKYERDLVDCITLADFTLQSERSLSHYVAIGGGTGGVSAGAANAIMGGATSGSVPLDIGVGIGVGVVTGFIAADRDRQADLNSGIGRCLENRGYILVNPDETYNSPEMWCRWTLIRTGEFFWKWDQQILDKCKDVEFKRVSDLNSKRVCGRD